MVPPLSGDRGLQVYHLEFLLRQRLLEPLQVALAYLQLGLDVLHGLQVHLRHFSVGEFIPPVFCEFLLLPHIDVWKEGFCARRSPVTSQPRASVRAKCSASSTLSCAFRFLPLRLRILRTRLCYICDIILTTFPPSSASYTYKLHASAASDCQDADNKFATMPKSFQTSCIRRAAFKCYSDKRDVSLLLLEQTGAASISAKLWPYLALVTKNKSLLSLYQ